MIVDGRINSRIEKVSDPRRNRARFLMATASGERIGIEVRGAGAGMMIQDWDIGDRVHVRGHLTLGGTVSADIIRRTKALDGEAKAPSLPLSLPLFAETGLIRREAFGSAAA